MEKLYKNFMWMAAANVIGSIFGIIIFIYLARVLEPAAFGYLSYAQTIIFYLANFIDLGLSTYGMREIAKDRAKISIYASEIVSFKLFLAGILYIVLICFTLFSTHSNVLKVLLAEWGLMLLIFALATEWAFQGVEKMHMVFVSFAVTVLLQFGLIYTYVKGPGDLLKVPVLYLIASLPVIAIFLQRLNFKLIVRNPDYKKMKLYLTSSIVIWSISIFAQVYNGLDIVILGFFRGLDEVGYFTIARRAVNSVTFLIVVLANALLPRLSCTFHSDIAQFNHTTRRFLWVAAFLTITLFLPAIIFSKPLILLTVGKGYLPAILPLTIMAVGLILVLFNVPYSTGLIAACFEKDVLKQSVACALFSIICNVLVMPRYGMIGAAYSFLATEALALVWIMHIYRKKMAALAA